METSGKGSRASKAVVLGAGQRLSSEMPSVPLQPHWDSALPKGTALEQPPQPTPLGPRGGNGAARPRQSPIVPGRAWEQANQWAINSRGSRSGVGNKGISEDVSELGPAGPSLGEGTGPFPPQSTIGNPQPGWGGERPRAGATSR